MATHFWPNEALHLLGGGWGWFPHKVKERSFIQSMSEIEISVSP